MLLGYCFVLNFNNIFLMANNIFVLVANEKEKRVNGIISELMLFPL